MKTKSSTVFIVALVSWVNAWPLSKTNITFRELPQSAETAWGIGKNVTFFFNWNGEAKTPVNYEFAFGNGLRKKFWLKEKRVSDPDKDGWMEVKGMVPERLAEGEHPFIVESTFFGYDLSKLPASKVFVTARESQGSNGKAPSPGSMNEANSKSNVTVGANATNVRYVTVTRIVSTTTIVGNKTVITNDPFNGNRMDFEANATAPGTQPMSTSRPKVILTGQNATMSPDGLSFILPDSGIGQINVGASGIQAQAAVACGGVDGNCIEVPVATPSLNTDIIEPSGAEAAVKQNPSGGNPAPVAQGSSPSSTDNGDMASVGLPEGLPPLTIFVPSRTRQSSSQTSSPSPSSSLTSSPSPSTSLSDTDQDEVVITVTVESKTPVPSMDKDVVTVTVTQMVTITPEPITVAGQTIQTFMPAGNVPASAAPPIAVLAASAERAPKPVIQAATAEMPSKPVKMCRPRA
jgi:hypothetical protein